MTEQHVVADVEDFPTSGSRVFAEIDGVEVVVFKIDDEFHAVANYCPHQGGPLCEGELTGNVTAGDNTWEWQYEDEEKQLLCPWHGRKFDDTTGLGTDYGTYRVPTYETVVDEGPFFVVK